MLRKSLLLTVASLILSAGLLSSQTSSTGQPQQPQEPEQPQQPQQPRQPQAGRGGLEPCWQQAGIAKSVVQQHAAIERETRAQVASVCSNASLTPQQKRQQVREIRQQAKQRMDGLATPEQRQAFIACRQERGLKGPGEGRGQEGGCGELPNGGSRPGGTPNAPDGGTENPPANPSSPQN